jgi:hypothetical protein
MGRRGGHNLCIGYVDKAKGLIYLDPHQSIAVATAAAKRQGGTQAVNFRGVGMALVDEGLCMPKAEGERMRADRWAPTGKKGRKRMFVIPILKMIHVIREQWAGVDDIDDEALEGVDEQDLAEAEKLLDLDNEAGIL